MNIDGQDLQEQLAARDEEEEDSETTLAMCDLNASEISERVGRVRHTKLLMH